jgi:hypothetical protein
MDDSEVSEAIAKRAHSQTSDKDAQYSVTVIGSSALGGSGKFARSHSTYDVDGPANKGTLTFFFNREK